MNTNQTDPTLAPEATTEPAPAMDINSDDSAAGTTHLNDPLEESAGATMPGESEKAAAEIADLKDRNLRLVAEFDNLRRRTARERIELMQTAGREIITDLLDVLDDSDRAAEQLEKSNDIAQIKEGLALVFGKLRNKLTAKGLKPMETVDSAFNADLHEAVTEMEAGEDKVGKVVAEVQKGYYLGGTIIRHAKVVVGK